MHVNTAPHSSASSFDCACTFVASRKAEERKRLAHEAPLAQIENENENRLDALQSIGAVYYISLWKAPEAILITKI